MMASFILFVDTRPIIIIYFVRCLTTLYDQKYEYHQRIISDNISHNGN